MRRKQILRPIKTENKEIFKRIIQKDEYAVGALLTLYSFQTEDEQQSKTTKFNNGMGFNGTDGPFCSSLAVQYNTKGRLTRKQLESLKKLLPKYHKQVGVVEPQKIYCLEKREKEANPLTSKKADLKGNTLIISFPFNYDTLAKIKLLSNRKWDSHRKVWTAPICIETVDTLMTMGFKLEKEVTDWYKSQTQEITKGIDVPKLRATLYPFQSVGVSFIDSRNGRALIGDEMGLGKTIQALAWMQLRKETCLPALIICPSSLKSHWARKTLEFTQLEPCIISGRDKKQIETFPGGSSIPNVYVINYDIIHEKVKCPKCSNSPNTCKDCKRTGMILTLHSWLKNLNFKTVIFDECHYTKTAGTGRTIAAMELSKDANHVIGLSGTPITNRPVEFYNIINMINPKIFPSWWKYTGKYCNRKNTGFGVDVKGSSNTLELHEKLTKTIMLRRLKKDVLTQLPPKVRSVIPINIDLKKYNIIIKEAQKELKDNGAEHLAIIEKAKQAVVELKMDNCIEWIQDYIDNDEKLVIFAHHRKTIETLQERFKGINVCIYGGTDHKTRSEVEDKFQNDPSIKLFIGSKAAKEGLTLTAAKATATIELWWTPGDHDQAEDRVHRIGQESDSVMAYYLLAEGTIEEDIAELLDEKRKVLAAVLDGKETEDIHMLSKLMYKINKEK